MTSYLQNGDLHFCCGCRACVQKCPQQCISMEEKDGFFYPVIDKERCINCGLCERVCQYTEKNQERRKDRGVPPIYSAWYNNETELPESTSGGIFFALAEKCIQSGGVVFGAEYTPDFSVKLASADTLEACKAFRKSKYIFSSTDTTYPQAESALKAGKTVLFSGTPCQIMGLYSYLGKEYENLYTVDLVCHGFNAPVALKKFIEMLEEKYGGKATYIECRHKIKGTGEQFFYATFSNGEVYQESFNSSPFGEFFNANVLLMPSCSACQYANTARPADLTIGDFWGIQQHSPQDYNVGGTSLILVNSEKGKQMFENVKENLVVHDAKLEAAMQHNPPLHKASPSNPFHFKVIRDLKEKGFEKTYRHYQAIDSKLCLVYRLFRKIFK